MATTVKSDIPATVWQVKVAVGDRVEADQELVVLESMKMEIPVLAEEAGTIADVRVNVGDVIQAGDVIATFDDPTA